jgi:ABC-2 type transport system permease protein
MTPDSEQPALIPSAPVRVLPSPPQGRSTCPLLAVFRRELVGAFTTPLPYVFVVVFLLLNGGLGFFLGGFFERGQAELSPFFTFHPWLFLFLIPALTMRMWAEERKSGTIELLLTLPVTVRAVVLGKFLAAWVFVALVLLLTFPLLLTVNVLGDPDNGVILTGYLGSVLAAGGLIAVGACCSALSRNQVVAFVLAASLSLVFLLSGTPVVIHAFSGWAPAAVVDAVASLSLLTHTRPLTAGLVRLVDVVYFLLMITGFLAATGLAVATRKAE